MIATRVSLDGQIGPFDCLAEPAYRLSPQFALPVVRELSTQLIGMADDWGWDCVETVHVFDGRADSRDTVHVIESGDAVRVLNEWGDREKAAVAVRINWAGVGRDPEAATKTEYATPQARKAARKSKVTGRGAARTVVVVIRWQYVEEGDDSTEVVKPTQDGRYAIGAWEWPWNITSWWCVCGSGVDWHEMDCLCGMTRDTQPANPLAVATWAAGETLRRLVPEATSALVDLHDSARIIAVFAGDTEIDTADDTGPFDAETLGEADQILRQALDEDAPGTPAEAGWEPVPDERTDHLYRVTFAPVPQ